jgi:hypothetical protein
LPPNGPFRTRQTNLRRKQARGFRQFLLRGFANVRAEWAIVCTVHNLLKLAAAKLAQRWSLSAALPPALAAR